ncbi:hypothetical protein E2C01_054749 [Portunus trituberculatus]|uniref:Uncharacterized protein n=1 Tax=Portunus trituberculatus TaxID=210409 RepID=A0A5B7GSW1_PORTR|nr:hypothetical protein [Portunus trituberculatus]
MSGAESVIRAKHVREGGHARSVEDKEKCITMIWCHGEGERSRKLQKPAQKLQEYVDFRKNRKLNLK